MFESILLLKLLYCPSSTIVEELYHYDICSKIHDYLNVWLTQRIQRVVINGYESKFVYVQSGASQGTVLGPLMLLMT